MHLLLLCPYQVAIGESVASSITSYLQQHAAAGGVQCEVITVPEDSGTADALNAVASHITSDTVVVYSGDLLSDVPLQALVVTHQLSGAVATVLVGSRKTSPTTETKPGRAPRVRGGAQLGCGAWRNGQAYKLTFVRDMTL